MQKTAIFLPIFFLVIAPLFISHAAELYVDPSGKTRISDAEITYLNNNVITVTLWGARWILFVGADPDVKVTNASGEPLTVWQLEKGHRIYVEGAIADAGVGKVQVDVKLLRDMSIPGSGKAFVQPNLGAAAAVFGAVNPISPKTSPPTSSVQKPERSATDSVSAAPLSRTILTRGMAGAEVRDVQEALSYKGYLTEDEVTGFFGEATERAVKKLQKANGLVQEGSVGPLTRGVIESIRAKMNGTYPSSNPIPQSSPLPSVPLITNTQLTRNLRPGMSGEEVKILQEFLQKNNFGIPSDGPVTGFYGQVTAGAVARFQQANGLETVGAVGPQTRALINRLLNK